MKVSFSTFIASTIVGARAGIEYVTIIQYKWVFCFIKFSGYRHCYRQLVIVATRKYM